MGIPATIEMMTHYEGDRWEDGARGFGPISINGTQPASPCLYAEMRFVNKKTGVVGCTFKSSNAVGDGKITIADAVNYRFTIETTENKLPLADGLWLWAFSTYCTADASDPPFTPWIGSIKIINKV